MNSPEIISISQFIRIDRRKSEPIYLQIAYQLINAVQRGLLPVGVKVPGTRVWSDVLGVHRKTVIAAFEELEAQNWIEIRPKIGTFVRNPQLKREKNEDALQNTLGFSPKAGFTFSKSFILDSPFEKEDCRFTFNDGQPDYREIKTQELARFYTTALKRRNIQKHLGNYAVQENEFFKNQLSYYLNLTRGFHVSPDYLLTAKSKEILLYTLAQLLIKKDEVVLVGELSHFAVNMIFSQRGAKLKTIPIDENGFDVEYIRTHYKKGEIRCLYLNSQYHYPTTVPLSKERRKSLIALAEEYDFVIIEDNDDYEFHYEKHQNLPLATDNKNGKIIHLGTIGKYLPPTFQLSFILASPDFIEEVKKHISLLNPQGNFVLEQALGEMIAEGDLFRYLKKTLKVYNGRRNLFAELLSKSFKNELGFSVPPGGLAYWLVFKQRFSLLEIAKETKKKGLFIPRICMYQNEKNIALRLGFTHWTEDEMGEVVRILRESYEKVGG